MAEDRNQHDPERLGEHSAPYIVSPELLRFFKDKKAADVRLPLMIELNLDHTGASEGARSAVRAMLEALPSRPATPDYVSRNHVFATLSLGELRELIGRDEANHSGGSSRAIYKVWPDRAIRAFLDRSLRTIKADACQKTFGASGEGIIWAVVDSGIDRDHPHFRIHQNLWLQGVEPASREPPPDDAASGIRHRAFTPDGSALVDDYGHGTHVAGIIAGLTPYTPSIDDSIPPLLNAKRLVRRRGEDDAVRVCVEEMKKPLISVAPRCKLLSLKVLDDKGDGRESALIAALDYVAALNDEGRKIRIHGVNLSLGYSFDPEWFAAGHSPVCVAVNRLVRTGVVVVAAAGNEGSAFVQTDGSTSMQRVGIDQSIADPGNADLAITVGSTHAESPYTYGVSYFSSRGPTADGRMKPDLVAPGERVLSCAASPWLSQDHPNLVFAQDDFRPEPGITYYREESGTSMAAPHVSGAAAALLSIRQEFVGEPERVKQILVASATDLGRKRDFQGAGLLDLFRAIQSV